MAVSSKHPMYTDTLPDWQQMQDTYAGERTVKAAGVTYLPPTSGMIADGMTGTQPGLAAYNAYKKRAVYHNFVREAVQAMLGVMHHKPPVIELPAQMEQLRTRATLRGESLEMLLRHINEQQLVYGRLGIMAEPIDGAGLGVPPMIATYNAKSIINWDEGTRQDPELRNLNLVVLDESGYERTTDLEWEHKTRYRVLVLGDIFKNEAEGAGVYYSVGLYDEEQTAINVSAQEEPRLAGGRRAEFIPFVFINACDIEPTPDDPPLIGLSNLTLAIYRGEADYRQNLFMQGQDTLVTIGLNKAKQDETLRTGAGGRIDLPLNGDAKYIGVNSEGLKEQREALSADRSAAAEKGGQLMDTVSRQKESGDALKIRVAARTATLNQIALTGAYGLEQMLKMIARWMGANQNEVVVTPNLDFADEGMEGKSLVDFMTAKRLGAPISMETIHGMMQRHEVTELDFEEELAKIAEEEPDAGAMGGGVNDPLNQGDGNGNQGGQQ
jgi:hypothetical protein